MGATPTTGLAISTLAGAGIGLAQQRAQSRSARRSAASTQQAAQVQLDQTADQAQLERLRIRRLRRRAEGRLAVTAADAGVGTGETFDALLRDIDSDAVLSQQIVDLNLANQRRYLESGVQATVQRLQASVPNAVLSTFGGGLTGFQTGLSLLQAGELLDDLGNPVDTSSPAIFDELSVPERPEF